MSKIIGNTVGMGLPKPNMMQNNPSAGDYVKGKENFLNQISGGWFYATDDGNGNVSISGFADKEQVLSELLEAMPTEEFTFVMEDGSVVTKQVVVK